MPSLKSTNAFKLAKIFAVYVNWTIQANSMPTSRLKLKHYILRPNFGINLAYIAIFMPKLRHKYCNPPCKKYASLSWHDYCIIMQIACQSLGMEFASFLFEGGFIGKLL